MTNISDSRRGWLLVAAKLALLLGWSSALVFVFLNSLADSALGLSLKSRTASLVLVPQGWSFFTKSPRDPRLVVYRWSEGAWARQEQHNFSPAAYFGLRKSGGVNGIELQGLLQNVQNAQWQPIKLALQERLTLSVAGPVTVENGARVRTLCGRYLVIKQRPVPWAWARHSESLMLEALALEVNSRCS